jgi:hypothetical protein
LSSANPVCRRRNRGFLWPKSKRGGTDRPEDRKSTVPPPGATTPPPRLFRRSKGRSGFVPIEHRGTPGHQVTPGRAATRLAALAAHRVYDPLLLLCGCEQRSLLHPIRCATANSARLIRCRSRQCSIENSKAVWLRKPSFTKIDRPVFSALLSTVNLQLVLVARGC